MQSRSRLTGNKRFSEIHREGGSAANRLLVIRFLANGLDQSRFGFMVSKRIGNAVVRNRVKRRLRDAVRRNRVKAGWDAVFIARRGTEKAGYRDLSQAADNLLRRSHLVDGGGSIANAGARTPE
ncbi:MAG: ribonuclease P protein component [Dehalococcoidia bacterium]|jgi:ribonuclease P protein component|nr:ribonuclease P protein component [Dehalococcoidia bacterium]